MIIYKCFFRNAIFSDGSSASRVYIPAGYLPEGIVIILSVTLKVPRRIAGQKQNMFQTNMKSFGGTCYADPPSGTLRI